jgi:hypothetical protein
MVIIIHTAIHIHVGVTLLQRLQATQVDHTMGYPLSSQYHLTTRVTVGLRGYTLMIPLS